ncbi:8028_t:CDS:2, partial [Racocetra persica]
MEPLVKNIVEMVVKEVVQNLRTVQGKWQDVDHIFVMCIIVKDTWFIRVHSRKISSKDHGGLKYNGKGEMKQKVDNSTVMEKLVKINGQAMRASISTGS